MFKADQQLPRSYMVLNHKFTTPESECYYWEPTPNHVSPSAATSPPLVAPHYSTQWSEHYKQQHQGTNHSTPSCQTFDEYHSASRPCTASLSELCVRPNLVAHTSAALHRQIGAVRPTASPCGSSPTAREKGVDVLNVTTSGSNPCSSSSSRNPCACLTSSARQSATQGCRMCARRVAPQCGAWSCARHRAHWTGGSSLLEYTIIIITSFLAGSLHFSLRI
jgi:hypothetical protein